MNINTLEQMQEWIKENLLTPKESMVITKQSRSSFNQSVNSGFLKPFTSKDGIRMYLKSEIENYARNKKR